MWNLKALSWDPASFRHHSLLWAITIPLLSWFRNQKISGICGVDIVHSCLLSAPVTRFQTWLFLWKLIRRVVYLENVQFRGSSRVRQFTVTVFIFKTALVSVSIEFAFCSRNKKQIFCGYICIFNLAMTVCQCTIFLIWFQARNCSWQHTMQHRNSPANARIVLLFSVYSKAAKRTTLFDEHTSIVVDRFRQVMAVLLLL